MMQRRRVPKKKRPSVFKELRGLIIKIVVMLLLVALTFTFVYGVHFVPDAHMSPNVRDGDVVLFFRHARDYDIDDLLLLNFEGERIVRRVVARAGDSVNITSQGLIINGAAVSEPLVSGQTFRLETEVEFPLTVGPGQVFVLGDARETAIDSRAFGPIYARDTLGTVITVIRRRGM